MTRRSISQRIVRAKSLEAKRNTVLDWAGNWKEDHDKTIRMLERAISTNDYDMLCRAAGQLKVVGQKHFSALPKVLEHLIDAEEKPPS